MSPQWISVPDGSTVYITTSPVHSAPVTVHLPEEVEDNPNVTRGTE